jgi:hypothetical protein
VVAAAALAPASGQAAAMTVPHAATHSVTPQVISPPSAPVQSTAPTQSATPPPSVASPSSGDADDVSAPEDVSGLDVGHFDPTSQASKADDTPDMTRSEELSDMRAELQTLITNVLNGLPPVARPEFDVNNPIAKADLLMTATNALADIFVEEELQKPEVAVRAITGYGEVTDEPCQADFWSLNDDAEDPNNGVASC